MSVQFLEARACQRHDLGEPVFSDGVLSMIVVPRRFTPCDSKSYCGGKVHHSDFNHCAKYHFHLLIISNRRFRQLTMTSLEEPKEKSVSRQ